MASALGHVANFILNLVASRGMSEREGAIVSHPALIFFKLNCSEVRVRAVGTLGGADAVHVSTAPRAMLRRLALLLAAASGVKEHDFRKCRDTPFCGRHRDPPATAEPFRVGSVTFVPAEGATRTNECSGLTATLVAPDATRAQLPLVLSLSVLATGAVRLLIDEDSSISPSELHRADPSVTKPAEWDEDMDGPWDAPMLKLGRAVKSRFAPTDALASPDVLAPVKCEYHTLR